MALNYRDYYNKALAEINPFMQQGLSDTKAGLADQGILASTAGQGSLGDLRARYLAQAAGLGAERAQADRSFAETQRQYNSNMAENQRQFGVTSGLNAYELQNSAALAKGQLTGNFNGIKFPNQPTFFRNLYGSKYLPPKPSSGPYGDPKEQWAGHTENLGQTLDAKNLSFQMADAAAARDLERERLDLQRQQFEYEKGQADQQADPWAQIGTYLSETTVDTDPAKPGQQRAFLPSDLINQVSTTFGIDILGEAKNGNPRAIAAMRLLYPNTYAYRLGMSGGLSANNIAMHQGRAEGAPTTAAQPKPNQWYPPTVRDMFGSFMNASGDGKVFGMQQAPNYSEFFGLNRR